jgi:hypothetical protein
MLMAVLSMLVTATFVLFQLDSADEQAAAIRRELDGRMQKVAEMEKVKTGRAYSCYFIYKIEYKCLMCI